MFSLVKLSYFIYCSVRRSIDQPCSTCIWDICSIQDADISGARYMLFESNCRPGTFRLIFRWSQSFCVPVVEILRNILNRKRSIKIDWFCIIIWIIYRINWFSCDINLSIFEIISMFLLVASITSLIFCCLIGLVITFVLNYFINI
jgi:hypothetical protein